MEATTIAEPPQNSKANLDPRQILKAPTPERPKRLKEFKRKLTENLNNLSGVLEGLTHEIRTWPDAPKEELLGYFERVIVQKPLTPDQRKIIETGLELYEQRHTAVKEVCREHPDDAELFTFLFKHPPKSKIEVRQGPLTLHFRCHNASDYALIYSRAFLDQRSPDQPEIDEATKSAGVFINYTPIPALRGSITAEYAKGHPYDYTSERIQTHEEQHAIKDLFTESLHRHIKEEMNPSNITNFRIILRQLENAGYTEKESLIKTVLRRDRQQLGENRAADEILAYFKAGAADLQEIEHILTIPEEKGGLYDYFNTELKSDNIETITYVAGESLRPLAEKCVEDVFVKEYHVVLENGINTILNLTNKGYTKEEITNLLMHKPLSHWPSLVKRLPKHKKAFMAGITPLKQAA